MGYCLCSVKDGISLSLGIISVVSWAVAEVPQIITNYKQKSAEGLSMAFLIAWIIGYCFILTVLDTLLICFPSLRLSLSLDPFLYVYGYIKVENHLCCNGSFYLKVTFFTVL